MEAIVAKYCDATEPVDNLAIAGIEISVDFYVRQTRTSGPKEQDQLRWLMVDLMRRHLRPHPVLTEAELCRPRWFGGESGGSGASFAIADRRGTSLSAARPRAMRLAIVALVVCSCRLCSLMLLRGRFPP